MAQQNQCATLAPKVRAEEFGVAVRGAQHRSSSIYWKHSKHSVKCLFENAAHPCLLCRSRCVEETGGGMVILRKLLNSQRKIK